ncbi:monovalent cation/H+ antiporter complex subunit F [Actinomycetospora termitidis]|uniref:Monovalent cation/H+ antiporter complex subunit F n=1 Tax=Actinomycetospora termitidis TaxID=3053470 RepID=A0ABT7M6C3_9PSEU|nr:monovalent cation/H+ antiporter complex subunit F [Actinomycetospora sp. Odt1-22]MDL5155342.1 monovalent cation/H+ antiporter complex subunit F [Actinomycetospora sp. Odt1-22]
MSFVTALITVALVLLGVSLMLVLVRFLRGPAALDRLVALDALVAVIMCGLMAQVALTRDSAIVPTIVAVSLVGFLGSSTVARFVGRRRVARTEDGTAGPSSGDGS